MKILSVFAIFFVVFAAFYLPEDLPGPDATAAGGPVAPVCRTASHDRLVEQKGRDVCGPAIDNGGYARAVGLMPTECPESTPRLVIDAEKFADRCMPGKTAPASTE
ncbi:hypothetical protein FF098_003850 [Parvularcula flava]|uniref:Uncharacterized protein n=1 Tax=Aquisalinus luteolus TaxID=1566827 RepID=A0A8J3EP41_9PROT|nr:hypothetical protein [Aquisalinus luteolus]NHK27037.1 hypothetical protein [Aquisalinus luteolus]GGH94172.1 hypothetical protein GCM10011355_07730 [Aquisalinus luteolus]